MYESNNVEFKSEINEKLEREVVGFLNSKGGHIYLGIDDNGMQLGLMILIKHNY